MRKRLPRVSDWVDLVETPAFVIDEPSIIRALKRAARLRDEHGFKLLYALKPLTFEFVLELMKPWVDGFATSSLFESRLAHDVMGEQGIVHVTTPGFRPADVPELGQLCDTAALNSLSQLRRFAALFEGADRLGLRINPQLSLVDDPRYDPCRLGSKLGVPLDRLHDAWRRRPELFDSVRGLQFHTNCDSLSFEPLHRTVVHLHEKLADLLPRLRWINLGGGYLFDPNEQTDHLARCVRFLTDQHGLDVYIEPGAALVRQAGYIVASVIDLFKSGRKSIAVLDTSVNHVPEVFEYQFEPDILDHVDDGDYEYELVGSSCLAGDVMGDYAFHRRLRIGSRVVLNNVGAYAMVKAHMFNGINLPAIYSVSASGELCLRRRFTYDDFFARFGACRDAVI